jgi:hypothetical protein
MITGRAPSCDNALVIQLVWLDLHQLAKPFLEVPLFIITHSSSAVKARGR